MNCDKHIHDLKNPEIISQIKINPRPKIYLNSDMFFFTKFKDKKNTWYKLSSTNRISWHKYRSFLWPRSASVVFLYLYNWNFDNFCLSSLLNYELKNKKNKFLYQNCKIYVIFKVWWLKCIFPETFNTLSMFNVLSIIVPFLSMSSLIKKSEVIDFQSKSNRMQ
jgi:hypothetical protein